VYYYAPSLSNITRLAWFNAWLPEMWISLIGTWTITAFYKGESQEKKLPGDWKEQRFLPGSPAHVM
jgi:hypothetical protein